MKIALYFITIADYIIISRFFRFNVNKMLRYYINALTAMVVNIFINNINCRTIQKATRALRFFPFLSTQYPPAKFSPTFLRFVEHIIH